MDNVAWNQLAEGLFWMIVTGIALSILLFPRK
ncbi:hypothetical protein SEA_BLAB_1 [Microbacterium phage Blab]|nr:hypothetical protein SEA_BLAB_1 [Microbacterium phage Blab]